MGSRPRQSNLSVLLMPRIVRPLSSGHTRFDSLSSATVEGGSGARSSRFERLPEGTTVALKMPLHFSDRTCTPGIPLGNLFEASWYLRAVTRLRICRRSCAAAEAWARRGGTSAVIFPTHCVLVLAEPWSFQV